MILSKKIGQSATEYFLITGIFVLVSIAMLPILQNKLSNSLQAIIPTRKPIQNTNLAFKALNGEKTNLSSIRTFVTGDDVSSALKNVPSDLGNSILTAGANGTTQILSERIALLALQLKDNPDISKEQYNNLIQLANEGHRLARAESLLEDAFRYKQETLSFEGKSYTIQEFLTAFGFQPDSAQNLNHLNINEIKPLLIPFSQMYQQLAQLPLLNSKEGQEIHILAAQILALADSLSWAACQALSIASDNQGEAAPINIVNINALNQQIIQNLSSYSGQLQEIATTPTTSTKTNINSSQICMTASGLDNGQYCAQ